MNLPAHTQNVELLYHQHGKALLLFAVAIAGNNERAQDAVHQVFLRLLESATLPDLVDAKAYMFASVRNALLDTARIQNRNVSLDESSAWFDPPNRDYAAELNLRRALHALPDDQRQVVVLHVWGELTFAQIADILHISPNTAASRYRYSIAKLREALCSKEDFCANR